MKLLALAVISPFMALWIKFLPIDNDYRKNLMLTISLHQQEKNKFKYKIINAPGGTYGYDIYVDEKMFIHQNSIPGISGTKGFATKEKAERCAKFVVSKLQAGETLPAVSMEDLKRLKLL